MAREVGSSQILFLMVLIIVAIGFVVIFRSDSVNSSSSAVNSQSIAADDLSLQISSLSEKVKILEEKPGPKGDVGPKGEKGDPGASGKDGQKGDTGAGLTLNNVPDTMLSSNVTLQGNNFNQPNQLVKLDGSSALPTLDGSKLTGVNASSFNGQSSSYYTNAANLSGQLNDSVLSSNVSMLDANQTAAGNKTFTGDILFANQGVFGQGSASAFQVQNASGADIFSINTASNLSFINLINDNNFESGLGNWINAPNGFAPGFTLSSMKAFIGTNSLVITTTTGAGGGAFPVTLAPNTTYTFSIYAINGAATFSTFSLGYLNAGAESACLSSQTVSSATWARYSCSFTTGGSVFSNYVYAKDTSGGHTFFLDAAQLEQGTVATPYGGSGTLNFTGTIESDVTIKPLADSTSVFQVQGSTGASLFTIDSYNMAIMIGSSTATSPSLLILGRGTSDPACANGAIYYNSILNSFRGCSSGSWNNLSGSSTATDSVNVFNSTTESTTSGANTTLSFDSENYDSNNIHDTVTNKSRLTIKTAGKYSIFGQVKWQQQTDTGYRSLIIMLNGSTIISEVDNPNISGLKLYQNVSTQRQLSAGDYLELVVFQNSGGTLNTIAATPQFSLSYDSN